MAIARRFKLGGADRRHSLWGALRRVGGLFVCALAGVIAGALTFGPLHRPAPVAVGVAVMAALLYGALWAWQQRAVRRWGWGFVAAPFVILVGAALIALAQLYSMGQFPPLTQDRVANFDRLVSAVERAYPYFDEKGIDWAAAVVAARPQVAAAQSDEEAHRAIAELLAALNDGHTSLIWPYPQSIRLGQLAEIDGQVVVTALYPAAQSTGLAVGDIVLALDGRDVETAIADLPVQLRDGSTEWSRRETALTNLLAIHEPAQSLEVTIQRADGEAHTVTLARPPRSLPFASVADAQGVSPPLVWGRRLPSGMGYIHLGEHFGNRSGHDMLAEFDAALAALMDAPGLILDLRENGGGNSLIANQIAGRFLSEPFVYAREHYRQRLPSRVWWLWSERSVTPRPPRHAGPVVLLIDATTVSSAEEFVISLVDSGRARSVGRQTAGSSGNPLVFQLPGDARARFSTGDLRRSDGTRVEGRGIQPDEPVSWTLDDVRQGRDPDLDAAEQWLLMRVRD